MLLTYDRYTGPTLPDGCIGYTFRQWADNTETPRSTGSALMVLRARLGLARGEIAELVLIDADNADETTARDDFRRTNR
jgi:hypothetical protein